MSKPLLTRLGLTLSLCLCLIAAPIEAQPIGKMTLGFARVGSDQTAADAARAATRDAADALALPGTLNGRPPAVLLFFESLPVQDGAELLTSIRQTVRDRLGDVPAVIAGCSTYGQFTSLGVDTPDPADASVAVGLLGPEPLPMRYVPGLARHVWALPENLAAAHFDGRDQLALVEALADLVQRAHADTVILLVHPDRVYAADGLDLPDMMHAAQERIGARRGLDGPAAIAFFGGITGNRNKPDRKHLLYLNDQVYDHGLIAIAAKLGGVADALPAYDTRHALRPAGPVFTVTRGEGRAVYELDDQPAAEVVRPIFADHFPGEAVTHLGVLVGDRLVNMGFAYAPAEGGEEPRDAAASLTFSRHMPVGTRVRVLGGDDPTMDPRVTDRQALESIRRREGAAAALAFNCVGRQPRTPVMREDIHALVVEAASSGPVLGFYSGGEIGPIRDAGNFPLPQFHHTTAVVVGIAGVPAAAAEPPAR